VTFAFKKNELLRIWILDTVGSPEECEFASLDGEERRQAFRFARGCDRQSFVKTRSALRRLLGGAMAVPPNSIEFKRNALGKPFVAAECSVATVHFNVSHTDGLSAIALSDNRRIGIDVERHREVPDKHRIAIDVFGAALAHELSSLSQPIQDRAFLQLWTAAEAYVKATGTGFAGLTEPIPLSLSRSSGDVQLRCAASGAGDAEWTLIPLSLPIGYCGSVVIEDAAPGGDPIFPDTIQLWAPDPPARAYRGE
jgi:phosphopantetheinyl transferase